MLFNVVTTDNDYDSIPSASMLEDGLDDFIRKYQPRLKELISTPSVGLNPLCRSQRRYTLS